MRQTISTQHSFVLALLLLAILSIGLLLLSSRGADNQTEGHGQVLAVRLNSTHDMEQELKVPESVHGVQTITTPLVPAFPGAEGYGAQAIGGRGGRVIEVTNLNNDGPGSLREAAEAEGPRTVVFRVAGIIELNDAIRIRDPYLTIAGQTAPGGGITIKSSGSHIFNLKNTHDVVIRYLRLRNGSGGYGDYDNLNIDDSHDVIADHLSMSWSSDENVGIWRASLDQPPIYNVTIQRSMMAEGLADHSNGMHISGYKDYSDPDNPIEAWRGIQDLTIHHNLFIHNTDRNPRVATIGTQVINNVVYNWGSRLGSTLTGSVIDYINNYYKGGPMSNLERILLHEDCNPVQPDWPCPFPDPSIYISGNLVMPTHPDPSADNWVLLKYNWRYTPLPDHFRRLTPLPQAPIPVTLQPASTAYASVLADVGANARLDCSGNWVSNVDPVDVRLLTDLQNNTGPDGPISDPEAVGGYPVIDPGTPCPDSDHDGMPDVWEDRYGFNSNDPGDGPVDADQDMYTNVEEYLNGTDPQQGRLVYLPIVIVGINDEKTNDLISDMLRRDSHAWPK